MADDMLVKGEHLFCCRFRMKLCRRIKSFLINKKDFTETRAIRWLFRFIS